MSADVSCDCPVCFESYDDFRHRRVVWPCGHSVCIGCDGRMSSSGLHMCPTCRTPRAGMSAAEATSHAEAARMRDIVLEEESATRGRWRRVGEEALPPMFADEESFPVNTYTRYRSEMVAPRQQRPANEVLFFANQAEGGGPAAMLMELEQAVRSSVAGAQPQPQPQQHAWPPGPGDAPSEGEEEEPRDGFNGLAVLLRGLVYPAGQAGQAGQAQRPRAQSPARPRPRPRSHQRARPLRLGQLHDNLSGPPNNRRFRLADADHPRNHPRHRQ